MMVAKAAHGMQEAAVLLLPQKEQFALRIPIGITPIAKTAAETTAKDAIGALALMMLGLLKPF